MSRALMLCTLCLWAGPALAQVYVGAAVGIDTTLASRIELDNRPQADTGGTTPALAVRAGIGLGGRWGAEVEVAHALTIEQSETADRGRLGPSLVGAIFGPDRLALVVRRLGQFDLRPTLRIDSEQTVTAVNALAWASYPLGARIDLVLMGGASFNRSKVEERYRIETVLPPGFPPGSISFGIQPMSVRLITYDVGPMVGAEARIAFGDRVRVVPGFRMSSVGRGWSLRPDVGVAWMF